MKLKHLLLFFPLIYLFGCGSGQYTIRDEPVVKDSLDKSLRTSSDTSAKRILVSRHSPKLWMIRTAPRFTLQFNFSYNYGLAELSNSYESVFEADQMLDGQNFGVRKGFGGFITGKWPLEKKGNVRLTVTGAFSYFGNNHLTSPEGTPGSVNYKVASLGAGVENSFTPSFRMKPYFAASLTANFIWGEASDIRNPDGSVTSVKFKPAFRIGYIISSGVEVLLSNRVGLNLGTSLIDANRILKESKTSTDPNEFPIRDRKTDDPLFTAGYKQFLYMAFHLGVNFYFGIRDRWWRI